MKSLLLIFLIALTSCTTVEFVRRDITPVKGAILRYPPQSDPARQAKFRAEAEEKARGYCGGDFQISKEYEAMEERPGSSSVGVGTGFGYGRTGILIGGSSRSQTMYHFVEIVCK